MPQVSFEVYAFDGARWSLQQNFSAGQREAALEAAYRIYGQAHIKGVRVIQETFDPATGEASEKSLLSRTKSDDVPKSLKKEIRAPKAAAPAGAPKAKQEKEKKTPVSSKAVPGAPVPKDMAPKAVASVTVPGAGGRIALAYVRAKASRSARAAACSAPPCSSRHGPAASPSRTRSWSATACAASPSRRALPSSISASKPSKASSSRRGCTR